MPVLTAYRFHVGHAVGKAQEVGKEIDSLFRHEPSLRGWAAFSSHVFDEEIIVMLDTPVKVELAWSITNLIVARGGEWLDPAFQKWLPKLQQDGSAMVFIRDRRKTEYMERFTAEDWNDLYTSS